MQWVTYFIGNIDFLYFILNLWTPLRFSTSIQIDLFQIRHGQFIFPRANVLKRSPRGEDRKIVRNSVTGWNNSRRVPTDVGDQLVARIEITEPWTTPVLDLVKVTENRGRLIYTILNTYLRIKKKICHLRNTEAWINFYLNVHSIPKTFQKALKYSFFSFQLYRGCRNLVDFKATAL